MNPNTTPLSASLGTPRKVLAFTVNFILLSSMSTNYHCLSETNLLLSVKLDSIRHPNGEATETLGILSQQTHSPTFIKWFKMCALLPYKSGGLLNNVTSEMLTKQEVLQPTQAVYQGQVPSAKKASRRSCEHSIRSRFRVLRIASEH